MSQRKTSASFLCEKTNPVELLSHQGRKYRRSTTTSAISPITSTVTRPLTQNTVGSLGSSPIMGSNGKIILPPPRPPHIPLGSPQRSPKASLSRSVVLPPPQPPSVNARGRPFSAKRSIKTRPHSIPGLKPTDEYRLQFALQHSKPLPPIPTNTTDPKQSSIISVQKSPLGEVDSAVDLEYYSHCGTPTDPLPLGSDCSGTSSGHSPFASRLKVKEMLKNGSLSLESCSKTIDTDEAEDGHQPVIIPTHVAMNQDNIDQKVPLCLKLPNGDRLEVKLPLRFTLKQVAEHAKKLTGIDLGDCEISTNEIPKKTFAPSLTLKEAGIVVRTVLHFSSM